MNRSPGGSAVGGTAATSRLRLHDQAQDVALAVFVALMQIQGTRQVAHDRGLADLDPVGNWAHITLLLVSGLVLAVRRRWPTAVFLVVAAASIVYYSAGYPDGPGWVGLFVALYTLTAYGDGRRSLRIAAGSLAVLTVVWLLTAELGPNAGWVFFRIGTAVMAAALGESVRMRRVLAAEAHERADRAERTREEVARRRADAERLRIAREVHDTVAHAITIINVQAGVTAHVLDKRPQQARETLVTIEQTSARALRELRATLGVLTDAGDDGRSPTPGLGQVDELAQLAREAGLDVKVEVEAPPRELPRAVDTAAYRILQESITNVIRHAGPARVTVSLTYGADDLRIRVTDDGRGASQPSTDGSGRGIVGMRERCELLGGQLMAGPRPDRGFEMRARLPVQPELAKVPDAREPAPAEADR